jgi:predicted metal-binding transcription factor (methanogenesis marker protein 9)
LVIAGAIAVMGFSAIIHAHPADGVRRQLQQCAAGAGDFLKEKDKKAERRAAGGGFHLCHGALMCPVNIARVCWRF